MKTEEPWRIYEDTARILLTRFRQELGLGKVEPKQNIAGRSGTSWEIDAKGVREGDGAIILIECRRYPSRRLNQEALAALAFKIGDISASGAVLVSPLPLQEGAKKVADAEEVIHVQLGPDSTPDNFAMSFLNKLFLGLSNQINVSDYANVERVDKGADPC